MVGWVRLREPRELAAGCPVEVSSVDDHAAHDCSVSSDEFRRGVDYDVCTVLDRSQQERRCEGVVNDERDACLMGDLRDHFNVYHIRIRIAQRFRVEQFRVRLYCLCEILRVGRIDECGINPLVFQRVGEEVVRPSVEIRGGYNVVPRRGDVLDRVCDRR